MNKEMICCRAEMGSWDSRFAIKGSTAFYSPDRVYDTEHIRLELNVDIARETINGICTTTLRSITPTSQEMVFDAINFNVFKVLWNGKRAKYSYKDGKLRVWPQGLLSEGSKSTVVIGYRVVKPAMGMYFIKPNKFYPKRPTQVWTQGEDEYARYWFPCFDAPSERTTTEMVATVPNGFTAVSNGRLVKTVANKKAKTATFHWKHEVPHATYLVTLAVGRFQHIRDHWKKVPVDYYCEKGREADTVRAFGKTPKMLDFFSSFIGVSYPYPKYAQVAATDFIYGGMENTSATTQTDAALLDERVSIDYSSDELVAHELAHQWFGDYLTCKDWSHAWLNESFATYFDPLFKRHDKGEDEFLYHMRGNAEAYFQEDKEHYRRSIVTKVYKRPTDLFDRHLYEKGSVVLHMLHRELGEDLFRKAIRAYVKNNRGRVVETIDLINAIEQSTGRNMRRFFDQWVFGAGHPEFRIRSWWDSREKKIRIRVVQTQPINGETGLFTVPTEFLFLTRKGKIRKKVFIDKKSHLFDFELDSEPSMIVFDPDHALLKKVDFPQSEAQLLSRLHNDDCCLGRIDAAHALAQKGSKTALVALRQALLSETFWAVQAEAAQAIGKMGNEEAAGVLLHCLDEISHPKVRRAILASLKHFKSKNVAEEVERKCRQEQSYFAEGERLRLMGALKHPRYDEILRLALAQDSWNDVIRIAALEGLAASKEPRWIPLFMAYTKQGHHQRLRMAAIRGLAASDQNPSIQRRLLELTKDPFLLVQITAVRALVQVGDERAVPVLKQLAQGDRDGRLKRLAEEAVEKITKGFE